MNPKFGLSTVPVVEPERSQKQIEQLKAYIESLTKCLKISNKTIDKLTKSSVS